MIKYGYLYAKDKKYEIFEQVTEKFRRLDIMPDGVLFFDNMNSALYSEYTTNKTYVRGDEKYKEIYNEVKKQALSINADLHAKTLWKKGVFIFIQERFIDEHHYTRIEQHNGMDYSEELVYGDLAIKKEVITSISDSVIFKPVNRGDYVVRDLDKVDLSKKYLYYPIDVLKRRHNLLHIDKCEYIVADNDELAKRELDKMRDELNENSIIGIDTEATGTDVSAGGKDKLVSIILSHRDRYSLYIALGHKKFSNCTSEIVHYAEMIVNKFRLVAHNAKFELKIFKKSNYYFNITDDSYLLSIIDNPEFTKPVHGLKYLEELELSERYLELTDIFINSKDIDFSEVDKEIAKYYACPDPDTGRRIFKKLYARLPSSDKNAYDIERELVISKADQEYYGFRINTEKLSKDFDNTNYLVELLEKLIKMIAKVDGALTSPILLRKILYENMRAPVLVRTDTGLPSTGVLAINKLASEKLEKPKNFFIKNILDKNGKIIIKAEDLNKAKYPIAIMLQEWKKYSKLQTGFYKRMSKDIINGRYYSWIKQMGARTYRQASPMHQLPPDIKACVLPDTDEHYFVVCDYSQIELRLLFSLAGDKDFIKLASDRRVDIHRAIGSKITNKPMWEISAKERKLGKARNFGVVYLMSPKGLAEKMYGASPTKEQIKAAAKSIDELFLAFKKVKAYIEHNREIILSNGEISTLWGRVRKIPQVLDKDCPSDVREKAIRQGNNHPIQGLAADIMKIAENNINRYIHNKGWDKLVETPQGSYPLARVMISAHDEADLSIHNSIPVEEVMEMLRDCMEFKIDGFCPLFASPSIINNWGEGKEDAYECPGDLRDKLIEEYHRTGKSCCRAGHEKDDLLNLINNFRETDITTYMENLIKTHNTTNAKELSKYVRHDIYTHELIARFPQTKEHIKSNGYLSHLEMIEYATERYLEFREGNSVYIDKSEVVSDKKEDSDIKSLFDSIINYNEDVNNDEEDNKSENNDNEEIERNVFCYDDEEYYIKTITSNKQYIVWKLFDTIVIDCLSMSKEDTNGLLNMLHKYNNPEGFCEVYIIYDGIRLNTTYKVDDIDEKEIEDYVLSKCKEVS